jgi:hypothetical protein
MTQQDAAPLPPTRPTREQIAKHLCGIVHGSCTKWERLTHSQRVWLLRQADTFAALFPATPTPTETPNNDTPVDA